MLRVYARNPGGSSICSLWREGDLTALASAFCSVSFFFFFFSLSPKLLENEVCGLVVELRLETHVSKSMSTVWPGRDFSCFFSGIFTHEEKLEKAIWTFTGNC